MRCLILLLFLFSGILATAKEKVEIQKEPDWRIPFQLNSLAKADLKNISNGYYLELYDRQINLNNNTIYQHVIRHLINETGIQNASELSVTFAPEYQSVIFHKIQIIRKGEVINRLHLKDIKVIQEETETGEFLYNGTKRAYIILRDIRKNDRIEYSYSVSGFNPVFNNKYTGEFYFTNASPIPNYSETIIADKSKKLYFTSFGGAVLPSESSSENNTLYQWINPAIKLWVSTEGTPSWFTNYPYISVTEFKDWRAVLDWGLTLYRNYDFELSEPLLKKIQEWNTIAKNDKDLFAGLALKYVQDEIRYLGIEVGEHTHKPHAPSDVYLKGYGDCKDKALLLATILRHENIPAYVALVNTSRRGEMYKNASSPSEFDHVIVAIERPTGYMYADATISGQRGEFSEIYTPAYGYALILKEGETNLRAMQTSDINSSYIVENLYVKNEDTSILSVGTTYKGGQADEMRNFFAGTGSKDIASSYVKFYENSFPNIFLKEPVSFQDDTIVNTISVQEDYLIPNLWKTNKEKERSFGIYAKSIHQQFTEPPASGDSLPLALKYPSTVLYTLNINMPEEWSFPKENILIENDSYKFELTSKIIGSQIKLKYYFKSFKDHIPPAEVAQYRKDLEQIKASLEYTIYDKSFTNDGTQSIPWNLNPSIIGFSAVLLGILAFVFYKLNQSTTEVEYDRSSGWNIGGWMIMLGISLCVAALVNSAQLLAGQYYNLSWNAIQTLGTNYLIVLSTEFIFLQIQFAFSLAILYWFLKRRDIFPKMFISYVIYSISSQLLILVMLNSMKLPIDTEPLIKEETTEFIRNLIYGAIWISYLIRAYRTKATFLKER